MSLLRRAVPEVTYFVCNRILTRSPPDRVRMGTYCGDSHAASLPLLSTCIEHTYVRTGVGPGSQAWEACMMPLHYVRRCLYSNKQLNRLARHLYIFTFSVMSWSPGCSSPVTESSDSDTPYPDRMLEFHTGRSTDTLWDGTPDLEVNSLAL